MRLLPFPDPIPLYNVDGTLNKEGSVTHYTVLRMTIEGHTNPQHIPVTNTGDEKLIIGFDWLTKYNPDIDWKKRKVSMDRNEPHTPIPCGQLDPDEDDDDDTPVRMDI